MVGEVSISDGREISVEDVSGKGNVRRRNIHQGSVRWRNVRRGSVWTPSMICSFLTLTLQNVWLGKYQSGKCPSGKCPSGMFLVEDVSVGDVSGREMSVEEVSVAELSFGDVSVGEVSGHHSNDIFETNQNNAQSEKCYLH